MNEGIALLGKMFTRVENWKAGADTRYIFLNCYGLMSRNMIRALEEGQFRDRRWVDRLMHHFADYYFEALEQYDRDAKETPAVWRQVHDFSRNKGLLALQHLLLGVNAHINYDLVLALSDVLRPEWRRLPPAKREERYLDHTHVNTIIARTVDTVQDQVIEKHTPWMDIIDRLCGNLDEWLISSLICRWREEVWTDALRLVAAATPERREALRGELEEKVLSRGTRIVLSTN
jgi:hypothetical protein